MGVGRKSPHLAPAPLPRARVLRSVNMSYNEVFLFLTRFSPPHGQCAGSTVIELHVTKPFQEVLGTEILPIFSKVSLKKYPFTVRNAPISDGI